MPERIQLSRKKGWRKPENAVSVARPGRWGNPYPVDVWGLERSLALFANTARGIWSPSALDQAEPDEVWDVAYTAHNAWLKRIGGHPIEAAWAELKGHDLACWCPPGQACHADTLLAIANR